MLRRTLLAGWLAPDPLDAIEPAMHEFVMARMLDRDGLCRSFLNAATLAPWTNAELAKIDQTRIVDMFQNSPDKAGCLNYENALMATGEFAVSQMERHRATNDARALARARKSVQAILGVIREGRHYMPGWLPKPFGGLPNARNSHEMSSDQYTKAIVALDAWRPLASASERREIDTFFVDAADFFVARKFRNAYRHRTIVTAATHHHALGLFVPILALADRSAGGAEYRKHARQFDAAIGAAMENDSLANFNMTSLIVEGYWLAIRAGWDDPRLPRTIAILWQRGLRRVDAEGNAFEDGKPPKRSSQGSRLAAVAPIVEQSDPKTRATPDARRILARQTDPAKMTHTVMPETIDEVGITSWLVAYWRLRNHATPR